MNRQMQIIDDIAPGAMVGLLAVYTYAQQAMDGLPAGAVDLLLGNVGTLVLALIIGLWLYKANQKQREQLEKTTSDRFADMQARLEQVTRERNEYLAELLEEREMNAGARPARRRPA